MLHSGFKRKGFSLIELLVVVAIIGVVAAVAIPAFQSYQANAAKTASKAEVANIIKALQACVTENTLASCATNNVKSLISTNCTPAGTAVATTEGCTWNLTGTKTCYSSYKKASGAIQKSCASYDSSTSQAKIEEDKWCKNDATCN